MSLFTGLALRNSGEFCCIMIFQTELLNKAQLFVEALFEKELPKSITFHTLKHTKEVVAAVQVIGNKCDLSEDELETVMLAAWLHDVGYCRTYENHEEESIQIATGFLQEEGVTEEKIEQVAGCIAATRYPQQPQTLLEQVICDADLYHLSADTYFEKAELLRQEWSNLKKDELGNREWIERNRQFLKKHEFFTDYGKEFMTPLKARNSKKLKKMLNKTDAENFAEEVEEAYELRKAVDKARNKDKKKKKDKNDSKPTRGIETMFRTTARNHLELSSIADNKANIMISINSIVISIIVTFMIRKLEENPNLIIPTTILLFVSLATIIFAVLSTRPMITVGRFSREDVERKKANLLFFGNFHKMELEDYEWGMKEMMKDSDYLYGSMTRDVYFLGKVLGRKYRLLRIAYSIFMYGFAAAVLSYTIAILFFPGTI